LRVTDALTVSNEEDLQAALVLRVSPTGGKRLVRIDITYTGDLHCRAVHGPSNVALETDAPVDNRGRGASFSPTDLLATALGTCMATSMGIHAKDQSLPIEGMTIVVVKHMTPPPRRVARLDVKLTIPAAQAARIDATARAALEERAKNCPVRLSLLPAVDVPITFDWA
jgi:putative redox protein